MAYHDLGQVTVAQRRDHHARVRGLRRKIARLQRLIKKFTARLTQFEAGTVRVRR